MKKQSFICFLSLLLGANSGINARDLEERLDINPTKERKEIPIPVGIESYSPMIYSNTGRILTSESQQERTVSGVVLDEANMPIPGANIVVAGTNIGTVTNFDGEFSLEVPADATTLVVSYVGYKNQEVNIQNKTQLNIVLETDAASLEEVVVIGYGTESRKNITASISTVDPEEIQSLPKSNVVEMLDGRLPGVQIMTDNSPGGGNSIRVRGFSTINNNDPLVIIDGVPSSNGLNSINPQDIESLQVLKDAASSSIYGSRAANGVVVITTKSGTFSDTYKVNFDIYTGVQNPFNVPDVLNAQQYGDLLWQATKNDGQIPANDIYGDNPDLAVVPEWLDDAQTIPSGNVNWIDEILESAMVQSYNLSIAKGDEKAQHTLSLGYFNQEGIIQYTGYERFTARFNSSYKIVDWLTIGENFTGSYSEQVSVGTNTSLGSIVYDALQFPSIVPVRDINGNYGGNPINDIQNPLGRLSRAKDNKRKRANAFGNVYANLNVSDFTFRTSLGLDYQTYNYRGFSPLFNEILTSNLTNSLTTENDFNYQLMWTNTLNYNKSFNGHNFDVLIGQEAIKYYYEGFGASRQNFMYEDPNFRYLDFGTENQLNSGNANEWALNSYFGRLNYNFLQKYLISATVRRDGTSRLSNNNWGIFPAASLGWRLDREDFFNFGDNFTSFLLRASWGQTGNQEIPPYSTINSYSTRNANSNYAIDGSQNSVFPGLIQSRVPNEDLEWETTTQTTVGIDLGFLNNKLNITADYYTKTTEDILIYNTVPLTFGGTNDGQWINDGKMKNTGYELDVTYSNHEKELKYDLSLNLTGYKNELTELNSVAYLGIPSSSLHNVNFDQEISRSAVGHPIGSFFGYKADGLFQTQTDVDAHGLQPDAQPGDIRFVDVNGDGVLNDEDRTFIGSPHPDLYLGFNINLKYKRFDLGMFFNASIGNDIYNLTKYKTHFFNQSAYNKSTDLLGAWSPENPNSAIPRLSLDDQNNNIRPSSYYVEDGSYLKLNNLQLGYTLNPEVIWGTTLRVYGQVNNVFTITDYSGITPQIGLQNYSSSNRNLDIGIDRGLYPTSRTFTFGLNLTL